MSDVPEQVWLVKLRVGKFIAVLDGNELMYTYKAKSYVTASPEFKALRKLLIEFAENIDVPRLDGAAGGRDEKLVKLVTDAVDTGHMADRRAGEGRATVLFEDEKIVGLVLGAHTRGMETFYLRAINQEVRGRRLAQWMYESYLTAFKVTGDVSVDLKDCGTRAKALRSWWKDGFGTGKEVAGEAMTMTGIALSAEEIRDRLARWYAQGRDAEAEAVAEEAGGVAQTAADSAPMHLGLRLPASGSVDALGRSSGGCDARSLFHIGVFVSEEAAKAALNAQIDVVHKSANFKGHPREHVGVDNCEWHHDVVQKAVINAGWHWRKVQSFVRGAKELADVPLNKILKEGGTYFLDGYLNSQYHRTSGKKVKKVKITTEDTGARDRHSTAVVNYMVRDHPGFIVGGTMNAENLWLNERATPDRKKGFMSELCRVYKVWKCTKTAACKGECCMPPSKKVRIA